MRTLREKVHTLGAENVNKSSTVLCGGKLQTFKFTCTDINRPSMQCSHKLEVFFSSNWRILHCLYWDKKDSIAVHIRLYITSCTATMRSLLIVPHMGKMDLEILHSFLYFNNIISKYMAAYQTVLLSEESLYHSRLISRVQIDQNINARHIL